MTFDCSDLAKWLFDCLIGSIIKFVLGYPYREQQILEDYEHLIKKLKLMATEVSIMEFNNEEIHTPQNKLNDIEMDILRRLAPEINDKYMNLMMLFTAVPLKDYTRNSKKEVDYEYIISQIEGVYSELKCSSELRNSKNIINQIQIKLSNLYKRILSTRINRIIDVVASMGYLVSFHQHFVLCWADGTIIGEHDYPCFSLVKT